MLFAPVGTQPLKKGGSSASFEDRVAMTRLAIEGEAGCELSLVDAPQSAGAGETPNYTAETLERLRREMPGDVLFLLLGADSLRTLKQWHRAKEIPFLAEMVVASRPGERLGDEAGIAACMPEGVHAEKAAEAHTFRLWNGAGKESRLTLLPELNHAISATAVRKAIRADEATASGVIPNAVLAYIRAHGLYR